MKLRYKIEVHIRKGKKNETRINYHWKNKKSDGWAVDQIDYCCKDLEDAFAFNFFSVETNQHYFKLLKHKERKIQLKEPVICLLSMDELGGSEGCPHEQISLPINNCPFCSAKIQYQLVEKKRITHECIKVKREYEECEDKLTEEIQEMNYDS